MLEPAQEKSLETAHICVANNNHAIFPSLSYNTSTKTILLTYRRAGTTLK